MKILGGALTDKQGQSLTQGMNNRLSDSALPIGQSRLAVNVDFDNRGNLQLPRQGSLRVYAGTAVHSWFEYPHAQGLGLFVEGSSLKRLNTNNTATTLKAVGIAPMSYCLIDEVIYFSNGQISGKYQGGSVYEWGVAVPPKQLVATATPNGGLYAGDYLVALTWLSSEEESGADSSVRVTVAEGGGIHLTNFPTPPDTVESVAVYVSQADSTELYLYAEYFQDVSAVSIGKSIGSLPLDSQFAVKAQPKTGLTAYNGRIYWRDGKAIRFTEAQVYGLQRVDNLIPFEETVTNIIRTTGPLIVTTERSIYAVRGIDSEGLQLDKLKTYGAARDTVFYDDNETDAYVMADMGLCQVNAEGVKELHAERVATPVFRRGAVAIVEQNGSRKLISVCQDGQIAQLQHPDYTSSEVARKGSGL